MSAKFFLRDILILFVLALLVRLFAALPQQQPNYMDAAYYYVNALNLLQGRGFAEDFIWTYLNNPHTLPQPSHLYWMPLTSVFAWLGMSIGGGTYRGAQMFFVIFSALLAPVTYTVTYAVAKQRWQCWLAGLLAIFSGFYFPYWTAIDTFTPFAVVGSLTLLFGWLALKDETGKKSVTYLIVAGMFVGLAHLARADGLLFFIVIIPTYLLRYLRNKHILSRVIRVALYLLLGYFIIMTPWFIRNWLAVGTPFPTGGTQSIWFTNYDDLFSYGRELSPQTFFAQGIGPILQGRWWVLITNLQTVFAVWGMIFLLPLAIVGFWALRRHFLIQLAAMYALLLFILMTFVFAFPGARGGLFHSGAALLPFICATAAVGLDRSVDWLAARRRTWNAQFAKKFFSAGLVILAIALSLIIYDRRVSGWNSADRGYPVIAAWVADQQADAIVMINNPPAYRYHGGGLSVVIPNETIETTLQVAQRYNVDYLIIGPNHPAPLAEVYRQTVMHPHLSLEKTFGTTYLFKIETP